MAFKISGFGAAAEKKDITPAYETYQQTVAPRKSLVQIRFPGKGMALTYYNDRFDLKPGDRVYVDGKLEGQQGRVTEVNYNFKIKPSDYKRVIALVDTEVSGQFYMAGSHFVSFDPTSLPTEQVMLWFKAPGKDEEEYISGSDGSNFLLEELKGLQVSAAIAERGRDYYLENRVRYLCLNGTKGFALVEGSQTYAVEFQYRNGQISDLVCDCPCACTCKHAFAAMLQLRETLEFIEKHYGKEFERTCYFAAVAKSTLFSFAIDGKETGSFVLPA